MVSKFMLWQMRRLIMISKEYFTQVRLQSTVQPHIQKKKQLYVWLNIFRKNHNRLWFIKVFGNNMGSWRGNWHCLLLLC